MWIVPSASCEIINQHCVLIDCVSEWLEPGFTGFVSRITSTLAALQNMNYMNSCKYCLCMVEGAGSLPYVWSLVDRVTRVVEVIGLNILLQGIIDMEPNPICHLNYNAIPTCLATCKTLMYITRTYSIGAIKFLSSLCFYSVL